MTKHAPERSDEPLPNGPWVQLTTGRILAAIIDVRCWLDGIASSVKEREVRATDLPAILEAILETQKRLEALTHKTLLDR